MSEDFVLNRKRDFNELLNGTGRFLKLEFSDYLGILLKLYLPVGLLVLAFTFFLTPEMTFSTGSKIVYFIVQSIDSLYLLALNYGFIKVIITGNAPTAGNVWGRLLMLLPKLLLLILFLAIAGVLSFGVIALFGTVTGPMIAVLFLPAVIFAIFFGNRIALIFPVINSEENSLFEAMGRSWDLTKGYWWQTFGGIIIIGLISYGLTFAFTLINIWIIQSLFTGFLDSNMLMYRLYMVLFQMVTLVIGIFTQFFTHSFLTLQYFNLVERKEAPELMARIGEIGPPDSQLYLESDED